MHVKKNPLKISRHGLGGQGRKGKTFPLHSPTSSCHATCENETVLKFHSIKLKPFLTEPQYFIARSNISFLSRKSSRHKGYKQFFSGVKIHGKSNLDFPIVFKFSDYFKNYKMGCCDTPKPPPMGFTCLIMSLHEGKEVVSQQGKMPNHC